MRNSILIGVLAALMLFAFTACEPQVVDLTGGNRTAEFVVVTQNTPFIEGQPFVAENFDVAIYYSDGGEPQVLPGTGLVAIQATDDVDVEVNEGDKVVATIKSGLASQPLAIDVIALEDCEISSVTVSSVTKQMKADATEDYTFTGSTTSKLNVTSVTYTAEGVSYTVKAAANSDVSGFSATAVIAAADYKQAGTVTLQATVKKGDVEIAKVPTTCTVTDPNAGKLEPVYEGIKVLYSVTSVAEANNVTNVEKLPSTLYIGDVVTITVNTYGTNDEGKPVTAALSADDVQYEVTKGAGTFADEASNEFGTLEITIAKDTDFEATFYYYNKDLSANTEVAKAVVGKGVNTVKMEGSTLEFEQNDEAKIPAKTLTGGADIKEYVQFVASNGLVNLDTTIDTVKYSISVDPKMSFELKAGEGVDVWYFVTYESYGETIRERGCVTLTADAENK